MTNSSSSGLFPWIESRLRGVYERVNRSTLLGARALSGFRIAFGLYSLLVMLPSFSWAAAAPASFYLPQRLSVYYYLPGVPPLWFMTVLDVVLVVALAAITVGYRARWATWVYVATFVVGWGFRNSFGKIDHGMLVPYLLGCLSLTDWGVYNAVRPDRRWGLTPVATAVAALLLCFAMLTAGLPKARVWLDFEIGTSGFLNWFYSGYFNFGRRALLMEWVLSFPPWLLEVFDYAAVALETSALLFLLAGPRWWRAWILGAAGFHLGATLFLNIAFDHHIMMYALFFSGALFERLRLSAVALRRITWIALALALPHVVMRVLQIPAEVLLIPKGYLPATWFLYLCVVLWIAVLALGTYDLLTVGRRLTEARAGHLGEGTAPTVSPYQTAH